MEMVLAITGIVGSVFTVIGVVWAVLFGSQTLPALLGSSSRGGSISKVQVQSMSTTRSKTTTRRATEQRQEEPPIEELPFWRQWVAETGRIVLECWEEGGAFFTDTVSDTGLPTVAGVALRASLVLAPALLTLGLTLWGVGGFFSHRTLPLFGEACLAGFLIAVASGFFLLGFIGVFACLRLVLTRDLEEEE